MKRKIIQQKGSFTITLPKKWIEQNKLTGDDEVEINQTLDKLEITSQLGRAKNTKTLTLESNGLKAITSYLSGAYVQGYDIIELRCENKLPFAKINKITDSLVGTIITEQNERSITIQCSTDKHVEVQPLIDKLFVSIGYIFSEILENPASGQISMLTDSLLKLRRYTSRLVVLTNYGDEKMVYYVSLINSLERLVNVTNKIIRTNPKTDLTQIVPLWDGLQKAYLKRSLVDILKHSHKLAELRNTHDFSDAAYTILLEYMFSATTTTRSTLI